jgi:hypothetical protein
MTTTTDKDFKAALLKLNTAQQRQLAAGFVARVLDLSDDSRIKAAVELAARSDVKAEELSRIAQAANTARVESFTQCGRETDWTAQAGHFVAKAAVACVRPETDAGNLAWDAAMQARMARTCQTVADGAGTENQEAQAQYALLDQLALLDPLLDVTKNS